MIKRLLLSLTLVSCAGTAAYCADMDEFSVDNFAYRVISEDAKTASIVRYLGEGGDMELPSKVANPQDPTCEYTITEIAQFAFTNTFARTVVIPNTVTTISDRAFGGCIELIAVEIPNSVTAIQDFAFEQCRALESIALPESLTEAGIYLFSNCTALREVTLPEGLTSIPNGMFSNCPSLTSVEIPQSVTSLQSECFRYSGLTSITLPQSLETIGVNCFFHCSGLTSIDIPASVTEIGPWAFAETSLSTVTVPASVTSIGGGAFNCSSVTAINVDDNNPEYKSIGGIVYNKSGDTLVAIPGALDNLTIPNTVTTLYDGVFAGLSNLTSVSIPASVTTIGNSAFASCTALTSIDLPETATNLGTGIFANCTALKSATLPTSLTSIPEGTFSGCPSLTAIALPASITSIGTAAFGGSGLKEIEIPSGVTEIGPWAFNGAPLTAITLPESTVKIGDGAFAGCQSLATVDIKGPVTSIAPYLFQRCTALTSVHIPETVETIFMGAFQGAGLTSIHIPESVTAIGRLAFQGCESLESVHLPSNLQEIDDLTFARCTALKSIDIPETTGRIGSGAFEGSGLTSVYIPTAVTQIAPNAFSRCEALTSVVFPPYLDRIENSVLGFCTSLRTITSTASFPPYAFNAFYGCPANVIVYVQMGTLVEYAEGSYGWNDVFSDFREMGHLTLSLSETEITLEAGENARISAHTTADDDVPVVSTGWLTSNPSVATVENGEIHAVAEGTAVITYKLTDGYGRVFTTTCVVKVTPGAGITDTEADRTDIPTHIYTLTGIRVKANATSEDLKTLSPGIYIMGGKKIVVK